MNARALQVPLATLIEDFSIYPRHRVDDSHVTNLVRALKAGRPLPPIVAEQGSGRIVDGIHRRRAYLATRGPEGSVPVLWRTYPNEGALFADAVALNSQHGRRLERQDEVRCVLMGERYGLTTPQVAVALAVPESRVAILRARVVLVQGTPEPAKPVAAHVYQQAVTRDQAAALHSAPGTSLLVQVRQLRRLIDAGLYDTTRPEVLTELHDLAHAILATVPATPPQAQSA